MVRAHHPGGIGGNGPGRVPEGERLLRGRRRGRHGHDDQRVDVVERTERPAGVRMRGRRLPVVERAGGVAARAGSGTRGATGVMITAVVATASLEPPAGLDGGPPRGGARAGRRVRLVTVLAFVALALTYALVVLGSTVRVTESGMGCPSWPLCYGHVGPVGGFHALLEESHRYLAGFVSVVVGATVLAAWRTPERRATRVPALAAAVLVVFQAGLGALTVFAHNAPWTVAAHLVTGLVFLGVVTATAVTSLDDRSKFHLVARDVGRWAWVALGATLALLAAGSAVVDGGAARACPSWPLCTHPAPLHLVALQLLHRTLAGLAAVAMVVFVVTSWRHMAGRKRWRAGAVGLLGLLVVVASFGAASALSRAAPAWQDAHLAMAAALWALLVALALRVLLVPDQDGSGGGHLLAHVDDVTVAP